MLLLRYNDNNFDFHQNILIQYYNDDVPVCALKVHDIIMIQFDEN